MIKTKLIVTLGALSLVAGGTSLYVNNAHEKVATVSAESKVKSQDELAKEKIKELNERVARGEDKVLTEKASFPHIDNQTGFKEADLVIRGKVDSIDKEYMEYEDIPFTDFKFNVEEYWKGNVSDEKNNPIAEQLIITQDGNTQSNFANHPLMTPGEEYVLFLKKVLNENNEEKLVMIGGPSGKFDIDNGLIDNEYDIQDVNGKSVDKFLAESSEGKVMDAITVIKEPLME